MREQPSDDNTMTWGRWRELNPGASRRSTDNYRMREQWKAVLLEEHCPVESEGITNYDELLLTTTRYYATSYYELLSTISVYCDRSRLCRRVVGTLLCLDSKSRFRVVWVSNRISFPMEVPI